MPTALHCNQNNLTNNKTKTKQQIVIYTPDYQFLPNYWTGLPSGCKRNFKWPSMQRWLCPIYNGTFKSFVFFLIFFFFKLFIFICGCHKNDVIFHIFNQIRVSIVLLWIGHLSAWRVTWNYSLTVPLNVWYSVFSY